MEEKKTGLNTQAVEEKKSNLDPNGRYLIKDDGHIYPWSEKLALRKDMKPYDPKAGRTQYTPSQPVGNNVSIELQGKTFVVSEDLQAILVDMAKRWDEMQAAVKNHDEEKLAWDAHKERLETDNLDLTEQLEQANARIAELEEAMKTPADPETPQPEKGGKKGK